MSLVFTTKKLKVPVKRYALPRANPDADNISRQANRALARPTKIKPFNIPFAQKEELDFWR